jgi:hypothetical protein
MIIRIPFYFPAYTLRAFSISFWQIFILPTTLAPLKASSGDRRYRSSVPFIPTMKQTLHVSAISDEICCFCAGRIWILIMLFLIAPSFSSANMDVPHGHAQKTSGRPIVEPAPGSINLAWRPRPHLMALRTSFSVLKVVS